MARASMNPLRRFARDRRGSAGIELALGTVALLTIGMLSFDLYSVFRVNSASARSAFAMADYLSRETAPDGEQVSALGRFLQQNEFGTPAHLVYVLSAVRRPPGADPAEILWVDDSIRLGDATVTDALASECSRRAGQGWRTTLLGGAENSGMSEGEVLIVAEVCARPSREGMLTNRLVAGDTYRVSILPVRDFDRAPASPAYPTDTESTETTSFLDGGSPPRGFPIS